MLILRIISIILIGSIALASCSFKRNSFENYSQTINETLNPASSNLKQIQNIYDVKDINGCGFDIELGVWRKNKVLSKFRKNDIWSRSNSEYDHGIIGSGDQCLDCNKENSTPHLTNNPLYHIVYIGPWHYAKRVGKEIRFVAYTGWGGGDMSYQFESKTPENKNIPSKDYSLPSKGKIYQRSQICLVKWIANHGYNSISKVKYNGFLNKIFRTVPTPTGEIIQVED